MSEDVFAQEKILARYAAGPDELEKAIAGLKETDFDLALQPERWSIRQLVHHVADGDDIWKLAIKAAVGNPGGSYSVMWYWEQPQDDWVSGWDYAGRDVAASLALFRVNRQHTIALVNHFPDCWEDEVEMPWIDGNQRRFSVGAILESQGNHALGHIEDILAVRARYSI